MGASSLAGCGRSARIRVIGVGNPLYGDEAAGYCMAVALQRCSVLEGAEVLALDHLGPECALLLDGCDAAVFLDAGAPDAAGEGYSVARIDTSRLTPREAVEVLRSVEPHSLDPVGLAVIARSAGVSHGDLYLVAVRASRVGLGAGLSEETVRSSLAALEALVALLERLGVRARLDGECVRRELVRCGSSASGLQQPQPGGSDHQLAHG